MKNLITVFLLILSIIVFMYVFKSKIVNADEVEKNQHADSRNKAYLNAMFLQWDIEKSKLNSNTQIYNSNKEVVDILQNSDSSKIFILSFKWDECKDCIDQELLYMHKYLLGKIDIAVIIGFQQWSHYISYVKNWNNEFPLFYIPIDQDLLDTNENRDYGVHSFVLEKGIIRKAHIASSSMPELSETYYKTF